jgi:hypothetical protein
MKKHKNPDTEAAPRLRRMVKRKVYELIHGAPPKDAALSVLICKQDTDET